MRGFLFTLVDILLHHKNKLHKWNKHTHCKQTYTPRWYIKSLNVRMNILLAVSPALFWLNCSPCPMDDTTTEPHCIHLEMKMNGWEKIRLSDGLHRNNRHEARNLNIRGWMAGLDGAGKDGAACTES